MKRSAVFTLEERHRLIAEAAYYRAQQRGFQGDHSLEDWLEAEREVDRTFSGRRRYLRNSLVFL